MQSVIERTDPSLYLKDIAIFRGKRMFLLILAPKLTFAGHNLKIINLSSTFKFSVSFMKNSLVPKSVSYPKFFKSKSRPIRVFPWHWLLAISGNWSK